MKSKDWQMILQMTVLVSQLGLTMIGAVGVAFFVGRFLDRLFGLSVVFTLIFLILGVGAGFWSAYRLIVQATGAKKDE